MSRKYRNGWERAYGDGSVETAPDDGDSRTLVFASLYNVDTLTSLQRALVVRASDSDAEMLRLFPKSDYMP